MCLPCGEVENATVVIIVGRWCTRSATTYCYKVVYDSKGEVDGFSDSEGSRVLAARGISDLFRTLSNEVRAESTQYITCFSDLSRLSQPFPFAFAGHNLRFPENVYWIPGPLRANRWFADDYASLSIITNLSYFSHFSTFLSSLLSFFFYDSFFLFRVRSREL